MTIHIMIDLETLDTTPNAVVLSVGAVEFDPLKREILRKRSWVLGRDGIAAQLRVGRTISPSTVAWWTRTNPEHLAWLLETESQGACDFVSDTPYLRAARGVWGYGATFDNVILRSLLQDVYSVPSRSLWPYKADRCFRTFTTLYDPLFACSSGKNTHEALADAVNQVQWMFNILDSSSAANAVFAGGAS